MRAGALPSASRGEETRPRAQTVFVDQQGNTVSCDAVRNSSVKLEYTSDGGRTLVRRVIVIPHQTETDGAAAEAGQDAGFRSQRTLPTQLPKAVVPPLPAQQNK